MDRDEEDVINFSHLIEERQFAILFHHIQDKLGCPPPQYRKGDGSECWTAHECRVCWREYTHLRALIEFGLVEKREQADEDVKQADRAGDVYSDDMDAAKKVFLSTF